MVTSFKQFTAIHRNEYGRRAVGIELSSAEAQRVAEDPTLARAYYDNWLRSNAPSPPHIDVAMTRADVAAPQSYIEPRHPRTQTRRADSGEAPRGVPPHALGLSITGLVLSVIGYLLTGTWLSIVGLVGLGLSIHAIVAARAVRPRAGWKAASRWDSRNGRGFDGAHPLHRLPLRVLRATLR